MSSCNALPQMWAISPTKTMGCAFKTSCNGEIGALQEFCAGSGERSGAAAGSTTSRAVASMGKAFCSVESRVVTATWQVSCVGMDCKVSGVIAGKMTCIVVLEVSAAFWRRL